MGKGYNLGFESHPTSKDVGFHGANKNNEICMTPFENGFMIGALSSQRNTIPECWKQLIDIMNKIKKDAGVEVTDLGNNMVQLKDTSGFTIVREKHDWE